MSNVGDYIKELRIRKGLTQEELGNIVGVKRAAVNKWESGMVQNLKRTTIQKLADLFDVSPSSFIDGKTDSDFLSTSITSDLSFRLSEQEKEFLRKYHALDPHGRALVNNILNMEYSRCISNDGMYYRAASSVDNHPAEIVSLSDEERERLAAAHPVTSEDSDL